MNKYPLPSDQRLELLIREAFEQMPGPDMRRVNQVQSRLARTAATSKPFKKPNTLPWWIVLVLTGGLVAAAWWVGDYLMYSGEQTMEYPFPQDGVITGTDDATGTNVPELPQRTEPVIERESPIIYLREEN